jgi:signal transduction histidine kinase
MRDSRASTGAIVVWTICVIASVASLWLLTLSWSRHLKGDLFGGAGGLSFAVLALACATVGAVIAARLPGHGVGRIFLAIGLCTAVSMLAYQYAGYGLSRAERPSGTVLAAWLATPVSEPIAVLLGWALLLFPDGRLPSPRWRAVAGAAVCAVLLLATSDALLPGRLDDPFTAVSNPIGVSGAHGALAAANVLGWTLVVAVMALGAVSAWVRLRRTDEQERLQLELALGAGAVVAAVIALDMLTWLGWPEGELRLRIAVIGLSFAAYAAAIGMAMVRYRLYDLDLVIERTLVYGSLTVLLAATYGLTTLGLATALGSGSAWATAGATLIVAVVFRPLRGALQDVVDRRFSRARYEAVRRVEGFLEELRTGRAEPEAIEGLLRELLGDPTLELRYSMPGAPVADDPRDARARTPVQRGGTPLAVVLHRPIEAPRQAALDALLAAGSLAIEMARLRVELRRQLAEVEASRARIVAAGHAERRRIERDLHDGAQQRLISIGLGLRHAQHELGEASPAVAAAIERAVVELSEAIVELRELAQGLPPSQLDAGLQPALKELADRAPLAVEVRATRERFGVGVEAAAYFVACEGLTNAIKHARATTVVLSAARQDARLVVRIADDGVGGAAPEQGSGLSGLRDRVEVHGGSLRIQSAPNAGTVLIAELPCAS